MALKLFENDVINLICICDMYSIYTTAKSKGCNKYLISLLLVIKLAIVGIEPGTSNCWYHEPSPS